VLDRVAKIGGIEPEIGECPRRRRTAGFPVDISRELADILRGPDAGHRSRCAGFGGACRVMARKTKGAARTAEGLNACVQICVNSRQLIII